MRAREMDSAHIQMRALPQGLTEAARGLMWRQTFISQEKERSVCGRQGHTRTGDNEIRVNESWKEPRPDGLVELLFEMHTRTRPGI